MSRRQFAKLDLSITDSSIWFQPDHVLRVWIVMMTKRDYRTGILTKTLPALARDAGKTIEETEDALRVLMSPDPYSRTKEHDGKRIEVVEGGWRLLNHQQYADSEESERERKRRWAEENRKTSTVDASSECSDATPPESEEVAKVDALSDLPSTSTDLRSIDPDPEGVQGESKPKRRAHRLPEDFEPNGTAIVLAREQRVDLSVEFPQFVDHYTASGKTALDWQAKLRTWIRNRAKWDADKPRPGARPTHPVDRAIQRGVTELERIRAREAEEERRMT